MNPIVRRLPPALAIVAAACGPASDRPAGSGRTEWALVEELRLGAVQSSGPEQFGYIPDLWVDGGGRLWVIDGPTREVRVFEADGDFVRSIGGRGAGPGEFEAPFVIEGGPGGNVWVSDSRNARWEVFDTAGTHLTSVAHPTGAFRFGDRWGGDGLLHSPVNVGGRSELRLAIVRFRVDEGALVPVDTLPMPPRDDGRTIPVSFVRDGRQMTVMVPVPFQPTSRSAMQPALGWWVSRSGPSYVISRTSLEGDTLWSVERDEAPVPVTEAQIDDALSDLPDGVAVDRSVIPTAHPFVDELHPLPDGNLLVLRMGGQGWLFDVFTPTGDFLASMAAPGGVRPDVLWIDDHALAGVVTDELGVPFVVRWRIRRGD